MSERWTEEEVAEINEQMASGAMAAIHELLDSGGIPCRTFGDDHVRNLIALFNQRGDLLVRFRDTVIRSAESGVVLAGVVLTDELLPLCDAVDELTSAPFRFESEP